MSHPQVALLRGVNVGPAKRVPMADLRRLLQELGFEQVRTLLNSGNAVYLASQDDPADSAARIERALRSGIGVSCRVLVLSKDEFAEVMEQNALASVGEANPSRLQVAVLANPEDRSLLTPLVGQDWGEEAFSVGSHAAYMWCPAGMLSSQLPEIVGKALGDAVTIRNWNTFKKIEAALRTLS
jgi:uncharacterized protein (DUF1697 family)